MRRGAASFALAAALLAAGVAGQFALARANPSRSPAVGESAVVALGGLRSLASEVVWFRAEKLQREGKFGELVQLASLLTFLEPHEPEVWIYSAWNLAYNVSVKMPRDEDRWPWVREAVRLLRDEGLKWNPASARIFRELAFLFEIKMGVDIDSASRIYRQEWKKTVEDVARRGAWGELRMDEEKMRAVEEECGKLDWTNPEASAIYWAKEGLKCGDEREKPFLDEIVRLSKVIYAKTQQQEEVGQ